MAKWTLGCVILCGVLIAGVSLQAHHSLAGVYALGKEAKVTGTFKAFTMDAASGPLPTATSW